MEKWLYLIAGGIAGTAARYLLAGAVQVRSGDIFPRGTLAVNLAGCFLIGFFDMLFEKKFLLSPAYRLLLMTGFCGAFTTLSTVILETANLWKEGQAFYAFGNVFLTIVFGFIVFRIGAMIAQMI